MPSSGCIPFLPHADHDSRESHRFVFLPFHRDNLARQGLPRQNGITHAEAGDRGAEEATFLLKTNDPAGFNIIDVSAVGCARERVWSGAAPGGEQLGTQCLRMSLRCRAWWPSPPMYVLPSAPESASPQTFSYQVLAWGALGHAAAFYLLVCLVLSYSCVARRASNSPLTWRAPSLTCIHPAAVQATTSLNSAAGPPVPF